MRRLIERQRRSLASQDAGFTLIEIIVAMVLMLSVLTALLGVLVSSLQTVAQARQRQAATAQATQTLERLRAIPYSALTIADPAFWPPSPALDYVAVAGAVATFTPTAGLPGVSETLVVNEYSGTRAFVLVDGVTYIVQTYVTKAVPIGAGGQAYNLTAIVKWTSSVNHTERRTVERSTAYSPSGCLSTAQHPFSGPCQAYFTAQAGLSAGGFTVTNPTDSTLNIPGMDGPLLALDLPDLSANLQIEQTASGSAIGATSGVRSVAGTTTTLGELAAASSVDSDPSSIPNQSAVATKSQLPGTASLNGVAGTLSATPTNNDSAWSAAAIAADSTTTCKDGTSTLTGLNTGPDPASLRPCAAANEQQLSTAGAIITYTPPSGPSVSVLSLAQAPTVSRAVAAQLAMTNAGVCSTALGASMPNCAHSAAYRSLGDLIVGAPTGGTSSLSTANGLFRVTGLIESVVAERGFGAAVTPAYTRTGHIYIWNGSTYTDVDLANYALPAAGAVPASESWTSSATTTYGVIAVAMTADITVQRPQRTVSGPIDCLADACVAQMNGGGGIRAQTTFVVTSGGTELTRFVLVADVGGLLAQSTYKAAPSG